MGILIRPFGTWAIETAKITAVVSCIAPGTDQAKPYRRTDQIQCKENE